MDELDTRFLLLADRLILESRKRPRHIQIRVERWARELAADTVVLRDNRNLHAQLLLSCVESGEFPPPYDKAPRFEGGGAPLLLPLDRLLALSRSRDVSSAAGLRSGGGRGRAHLPTPPRLPALADEIASLKRTVARLVEENAARPDPVWLPAEPPRPPAPQPADRRAAPRLARPLPPPAAGARPRASRLPPAAAAPARIVLAAARVPAAPPPPPLHEPAAADRPAQTELAAAVRQRLEFSRTEAPQGRRSLVPNPSWNVPITPLWLPSTSALGLREALLSALGPPAFVAQGASDAAW
jgi:hypothetical protein